MQTGIMIEPQIGGSYQDIRDLARWAEGEGFDSFARSDHYLNMRTSAHATEALATLAGLAVETREIGLTVLVTPLTFRHPAVIAKTAATLHEMSAGRFELGVGTGWMEGEHDAFGIELGALGNRFDRLEEALGYLWAALGRTSGGFSGEHFALADIDVAPAAPDLPIVIGGSGMRRTPTLAGRYADEYNMFVTDVDTLQQRLAVMRDAADAVGRDPDAILISMLGSVIIGEDEADLAEIVAIAASQRDMSRNDYLAMLRDRHLPHGTPDAVADRVAELARAGVGRFYVQVFDPVGDIDRRRVSLARAALAAV